MRKISIMISIIKTNNNKTKIKFNKNNKTIFKDYYKKKTTINKNKTYLDNKI